MDTLKIAKLMLDAASTLSLEEVMYSLGLDSDHAETHDLVEVFDAQGKSMGVKEVLLSDEEADRRLEERVAAHNSDVAALVAAAHFLLERDLGVTSECAPGGSGLCDGLLTEDVSECRCGCHTAFFLPGTVEGVKQWHDEHHASLLADGPVITDPQQ